MIAVFGGQGRGNDSCQLLADLHIESSAWLVEIYNSVHGPIFSDKVVTETTCSEGQAHRFAPAATPESMLILTNSMEQSPS